MRLLHTSFLFMLLLIGCSKADRGTQLKIGRLELVWAVQPEQAEDEPWFAEIDGAKAWKDRILIPDWKRNTIIQLNRDGSFIQSIGKEGPGPGEFEGGPYSLWISPSGSIWGRLDWPGTFNVYSPDGVFIEKVDHQKLFAGTPINPFDLIPLADNSYVYGCGISLMRRPTEEQCLQTPLLVRVQDESWMTLAERWLTEEEDSVLKKLLQDPRISLIDAFTSGFVCIGQNQNEILFLKACAPYTVYRIAEDQEQSSFTYFDVVRKSWTRQFEYSIGEGLQYWPAYRLASSQRGVPTPQFTWTHAIEGLARFGDSLVLQIRVIGQDVVHHTLYVVDLNEERLVMTVPLDFPEDDMAIVSDAFQDGTLIFTVFKPVPGVRTYRIARAR